MPTTQKLKERLLKKLKELFQLDQPDLDFGFYRIMRAKARQIQKFLDIGLSKKIEESFANDSNADAGKKFGEVKQLLISQLGENALNSDGSIKDIFSETPIGKEYKQAWNEANKVKDADKDEAEIYDHLYRFFERYYDEGDFISLRYYSGETDTKAAPFAIPYNGEEVKLHWANADQYYIKTTEHFSNFSFDLQQGIKKLSTKDKQTSSGQQLSFADNEEDFTFKAHFQIVDATEGEHGNVKASEAAKRQFIIHQENPVAINDKGELVVNFEYKPLSNGYPIDPEEEKRLKEKYGAKNKRDYPVVWMSDRIIAEAGNIPELKKYFAPLQTLAPTESVKKRPIIAKYLAQYTARNTMDYFIHKDLGGFLRRELDFYIKNEVMRLDDIENADAPKVENYLSKIKTLRRIARKLIDFLAQLENFQKKLWLKKKFVTETNYCVTLDRIPETLYPEIAMNDAQREEWVRLFAIDEIKPTDGDLVRAETPGYSAPLSVEFLKTNDKLVLDTTFFSDEFNSKLLESISDFDEQCDGLLIHSENFQALNLLQERYREQVKCVYIDPPYNTDAGPIAYKNGYRSSSWISFIADRLYQAKQYLSLEGILCITIDDYQVHELAHLLDDIFGKENQLGVAVIRNNPSGRSTVSGFSICHEYAFFYQTSCTGSLERLPRSEKQIKRFTIEDGKYVDWRNFRKDGGAVTHRMERPKQYYPIYINVETNIIRIPKMKWNEESRKWDITEQPRSEESIVWPIDEKGRDRVWSLNHTSAINSIQDLEIRRNKNDDIQIYRRHIPANGVLPRTWWDKKEYAAREYGSATLTNLFGNNSFFSFSKSPFAVQDAMWISGLNKARKSALDYFAGSGTTGHAVINLNREDNGRRKYILVEMGDYFETVLKPRISKVVYSEKWKNGKPTSRNTGISHCFKYLRLESYEDTLNNLHFDDTPARSALMKNPVLKEDYMLRYMLDVETRGSQSLLNIDAFADPESYALKVKKPGSDEYVTKNIDLIETFNYLIGLRVDHIAAPQTFSAEFKRSEDPEVPKEQQTRLLLDGKIKQDNEGAWWFRKVEGWTPKDMTSPNNGQREKTLIIWRKLTGDQEKDNLMLDEFFQENCISTGNFDFDVVYVNGSNNLPNLKRKGNDWKVSLIEEEFMKRMWDTQGL